MVFMSDITPHCSLGCVQVPLGHEGVYLPDLHPPHCTSMPLCCFPFLAGLYMGD